MKTMKNFSLLFLLFSISQMSFANNDTQETASSDVHFLTIQEYCQCLISVASTEDVHDLYNPETMRGEILQTISSDEQQSRFLYSIPHGVDPLLPMQGLTESDAMRCCNFLEISLPDNDSVMNSTEIGSYILHEDGSFEVNDQAQLHLLSHDD